MGAAGCRPESCDACDLDLAHVDAVPHPSVLSQALISAARDGDHVAVRVALAQGAYVDGGQPLKLLTLDRMNMADPVRECGFRPLMYASHNGNLLCLEPLLDARADVNASDEEGTTVLHLAASSGDWGCFAALLAAGADPHALDDTGLGVRDYIPNDIFSDPKQFRKWMQSLEAAESGHSKVGDESIPSEGAKTAKPSPALHAEAIAIAEQMDQY
mmetsp:Transcript_30917/g.81901  ORF Transcript_30917/g.81901 Transcript_30917/m.81901 type:complete len:215 (+) Transcript_30917:151-795(+)